MVLVLAWSAFGAPLLLHGQGRGGAEWTTSGHDAQRTAWVRTDARLRKDAVVKGELKPIGGEGGVIGLDAHGNVAMSFNVTGMGRGYVGADG